MFEKEQCNKVKIYIHYCLKCHLFYNNIFSCSSCAEKLRCQHLSLRYHEVRRMGKLTPLGLYEDGKRYGILKRKRFLIY